MLPPRNHRSSCGSDAAGRSQAPPGTCVCPFSASSSWRQVYLRLGQWLRVLSWDALMSCFTFPSWKVGGGAVSPASQPCAPLSAEKLTLRPGAPRAPNPSRVTLILMSQCCLPAGKRLIPDLSEETLEKAEENTLCSPPALGSGGVPNLWLASWSNYTPCPGHCPDLILPKKLQGIREESGHPYQVSHPSLGRRVPSARGGDGTRSPTIPASEGSCPLTSESSGSSQAM